MGGKVSVLMGIYNCADTLRQAIESVQNQTYTNWELILCDDGSTDNTYELALQFSKEDSRIIVLKNERNYGLNITLNHCYRVATGEYIARMDGDDDCMPDRFEKQVTFLQTNPEYAIVSSSMIFFDRTGEWGKLKVIHYPSAFDVVTGSPICHAPVMMRKECMDAVGGYAEDIRKLRVEDVDLWIRLYAAGFKCYNFDEPLYRMRNDQNALNRRKYRYRINSTYTRIQGCKLLKLSAKAYILSFIPMISGLIPGKFRMVIRRLMSEGK